MSRLSLLDDQPANVASDRLFFGRYLNALEHTVLERNESNTAPLVVGIFSPWGSGKSTLLGMLEERLQYQPDDQVGGLENTLREQQGRWVVVKFSPWMYRNEKSLLLPLLATLAKKQPAFESLIQQIVESGPGLIKKLTGTLIDASTTGLPLLTFLDSVRKDKENAKDLQEKIAEAVKIVTGENKRLVFLIDDLDRCHDPKQIVNLLEQIKLFLHLPRCLFFLAADRKHIIDAINEEFPNSGEAYLEKFVQVSFYLPPIHSQHLVDVLGIEKNEKKAYRSMCEVLGNNPRKLKQLWNEAVLAMEVLNEEKMRVTGLAHEPDMELVLKWLLLKDCGELRANPFRYLEFERAGNQSTSRDEFLETLGFKNKDNEWQPEAQRKLAVFLWNDLDGKRFGQPNILSLYAHACGESNEYARSLIEEGCFEGGDDAAFDGRNFADADLSNGHFQNATFTNCDFKRADFCHAVLSEAKFSNCNLAGARFDDAKITNTVWENCIGLDELDTKPHIYEQIADAAVAQWHATDSTARNQWHKDARYGLFKAYRTILELHLPNTTLSEIEKKRIIEKGQTIRADVEI